MKGYLKTAEGLFQLAPKVTTVGREGCDLVIQTPEVDFQHAVLEYSDQEECFVLQDLNTAQGTYVNDCRVQNAAVRLAPGDMIRFGASPTYYELDVEAGNNTVAYPPVYQRAAWTQPLTVITDQRPPVILANQQPSSLPTLKSITSSQTAMWSNSPTGIYPRPPNSIRSRPLSAGARRPAYMERASPPIVDRNTATRNLQNGGGWVAGVSPARTITTAPQTTDISVLQEKEQRILRLNEEVKRMAAMEGECGRKDEVIHQLREEIADLQGHLRQRDTAQNLSSVGQNSDIDLTHRLLMLQDDVQLKKTEILSLKDQISRMQANDPVTGGAISRQDHNDRVMEVNSLKTELERVRKDKNITSGLVTQMQRDMASKDTTISRLTRDIDSVKKEIKEKDAQLSSMQSKFRRTQESKKNEEDLETKDKELAALRQTFKSTENKIQEQLDLISALKEEMEKVKSQANTDREGQKKVMSDLDQVKTKCQDVERAERMVRVDLEQVSKRLERFRNRVVQVTFSTPGIKAPDTEITDDELLDTLKKLMEERTEMFRKISDMKDSVNDAQSSKKDFIENSKKLKQQINSAVLRLREKGQQSGRLRQETEMLGAVALDDSVSWMKDSALELLQVSAAWQTDIEGALEACGINVKLSDDAPSVHIKELHTRCQAAQSERDDIRGQMADRESKHAEELAVSMDVLRQELEETNVAEIEKQKLLRDEQTNIVIAELKDKLAEDMEVAVGAEKAKITELEISIEKLKESLLSREDTEMTNKEATKEALDAVEEYQKLELELREKITLLEANKSEEVTKLQEELDKKIQHSGNEVIMFKEQIQQHSVTILAMEERLNKVMKKNKDYQAEISQLKGTISELRTKSNKPVAAPKPRVIIQKPAVDLAAMETTMMNIQRENADLKRQLQEQHDVILNLRRDLAGTSAKLSDMTGELSEKQKEAMETKQRTIHDKQTELLEARQQLAKLSEIIDKQAEEIKDLTEDLSKHRSLLSKNKSTSNERDLRVVELEAELAKEKEESKKNLKMVEEEGHITSELTAMGAQCRGERHEQVITRQREALTELRARIKALEQSKPPLPSQDQALQQVVMLKKELSEIRASQALTETNGITLTPLEQHINKARGLETQGHVEVDHERSAHRETMEALEISEQSFLTLLRAIASTLELEDISGLRSMAHIPKDERVRLARERESSVELLTSRIKVLVERIARKDELLQGYEKDLAKLRQAEKLAEQKHVQVESLANDIRSRTEESQYLRESLQRTKSQLDQEKRLNSKIKTKKTFHLENERDTKGTWPRHHCPPEDILGKEAAKRKASNEKMKKKNYEIKTLKTELGNKERYLMDARRKLVTMETSLGYEGQRDPFEPPSAEV